MDAETEIIPLTAHEIPTVLSFDRTSNEYVIGTAARALGIKGQTNIFNFKPDLGISPARFDKDKKYWVRVDETGTRAPTNAFTPREVSKRFLELLLAGVSKRPECLIIGEPAIRDKTWREHFRQHMRAILTDLGIPEPQFFPEPFAVFQYFRHIAHVLPKVDSPQTILVIDIGGGTFDTCIIRTTQSGNLARGGATAIPLGIQSVATAGRDIDRALLDTLIKGARNSGIRFKDDPIKRAESVSIPVLFFVENAKIKLSEKIHGGGFEENYGHISETVVVPAKVLHPDCEIRVDLTGEDLKRAISSVWHRSLGDTMLACVKEAGISRIDKVLIAGGSARLPFLSELVYKTLKTLVRKEDIVVGECAGEAVAYGIGVECREQLQRNPKLATDRIAPCVLNDLYLSFSQSRYEPARPANSVRPRRTNGQLLLAPLQTDTLETNYVFELPFSPKKQLFYWFTGQPVNMSSMGERLNVAHDVLRVPPRASRRLRLQLSFKENGEIIPTVEFQVIDSNGRHAWQESKCPPFYFPNFRVTEGKRYFGLDFGTSNSYMVEFISSTIEPPSTASYPELRVSQKTVQRLRELSLQLDQLRLEGILTRSRILKHAADSALNFVFHSNKIEGSPLTIGETEVLATQTSYLSTDEKEALGAKTAYDWMVENCESVLQSPQPFWRTLNKILLNEVLNAAGSYRNDSVKISGAAFSPPEAFAVPEFLDRLTEEIRTSLSMRSPLELAAAVHAKFVWIHPFNDGNGRTARLLLNAILLASGLPIVVVNFDDRSRYMDALANADRGNLSPFVDLLLECLEYSLGSLKLPDRSDSNPEEEASEESSKTIPSNDPVEEALEELENTVIHNRDGAEPAAEISPEDDHDLLELVMASKLQAEQANYEAWKQAFESIAKQAEALAANFNRRYSPKGYSIDFRSYDMLTREKYDLLTNGFTAPRTWLFSWDLRSPNRHTRLMFFFQCSSQGARRIPDVAGASLAISRHDGDVYRRLSSEPIWLREIAYARGNLTSLGATERRDIPIVEALKNTLAETIKAYL